MAEWVAVLIAVVSAAGAGATWWRVSSQNRLDEARAGVEEASNVGAVLEQNRKLMKDVDAAWERIRTFERQLAKTDLLVVALIERARDNGDDLEGFNGTYQDWLARQTSP